MSSYSPAGVHSRGTALDISLRARWTSVPGSRAPPRAVPTASRWRRPTSGSPTTSCCWRATRAARRGCVLRGARPGDRVGHRAPAGAAVRGGAARLPAAAARPRCRSTCGWPSASARELLRGVEVLRRAAAARRGRRAVQAAPTPTRTSSRSSSTRRARRGTPRPVELTFGNLARARARRRCGAGLRSRRALARARCRSRTSAG